MVRYLSSRWWLPIWGVVVAGSIIAARNLRIENRASDWTPDHPSSPERFWEFTQRQFGGGDVVLVGVRAPAGDSVQTGALEEWLATQPEVTATFGPSNVQKMEHGLRARLMLGSQLGELRRAVMNRDSAMALVYVTLRPPTSNDSLRYRRDFLNRLQADGPHHVAAGTTLMIAGKPAADVALSRLLREDMMRSAPLALVAAALVLIVIAHRQTIGPVVGVAAAVVLVMGGLALFGKPISTATVITLPITAVAGLAYGIHMEAAIERRRSAVSAMRELSAPLRWAFGTTAAALLSFTFSPIPALRAFAWSASGGVSAGFLAAFTLVPHLRRGRRAPSPSGVQQRIIQRSGFRLYAWAARRPMVVTLSWVLLGVVMIAGFYRLRVEPNNYLGFFPRNHPTMVAHRTIDRVFGGSLPMFVVADVDSGDAFRESAVRRRIRLFIQDVEKDSLVGASFAPFLVDTTESPMREWFQGRDTRYARGVMSVPLLTTPEARALLRVLDSTAATYSDSLVRLRVTGPVAAGLPLLRALVDTQVRSLGLVLVIVAVALFAATRSVLSGAFLLLPNVVAPAAVGAMMGFCGVALDFGTIVVFSMVLGVAVDDTLQIISAGTVDVPGSRFHGPAAMRRVLVPVTLTSLSAVVGFGALVLSPFPVTQRLGLLMAVGLATAWLADLTVTPLLMARRAVRVGRGVASG